MPFLHIEMSNGKSRRISFLLQATKAASDAWKSMSLEEKAKYTRRAREVWDNYLSTAPVRTPKPRKQVGYSLW